VAEKASSATISLWERSFSVAGSEDRLPKWLLFSLVLHGIFVAALFIASLLPSSTPPEVPVYVVDLVGGEKIGGMKLGTEMRSPPEPAVKAPAPTPAASAPAPKPEVKKETAEKSKPVEKNTAEEKKIVIKEKTKPESAKPDPVLAKKEPAKEMKQEAKSESASADSVRERLLQAAVDRAKSRENPQKPAKGDTYSAGSGEGEGAAGLGSGGRGGPGIVKGMDFIIYQNRMLGTIKDNWTWVGQRSNLKVVVHFGVKETGEIVGLKIVQPSGDPSYDESVVRAVKKSSPLPAPPESYRKDFADVELTFRPRDLGA
jgi:colicin import membrane protein